TNATNDCHGRPTRRGPFSCSGSHSAAPVWNGLFRSTAYSSRLASTSLGAPPAHPVEAFRDSVERHEVHVSTCPAVGVIRGCGMVSGWLRWVGDCGAAFGGLSCLVVGWFSGAGGCRVGGLGFWPVGWVGACGCAGAASLVGWLAPAPGEWLFSYSGGGGV